MDDHGDRLDDKTRDMVSRARKGDREAFGALYKLYEKRLKAAVRTRIGQKLRGKIETADPVQSVWKDVLSGLDGFEYRGPDSFFRWILVRVIRKIQDKARYFSAEKRNVDKEKRLGNGSKAGVRLPNASGPTPSQAVMADEDLDRLLRLLDRLPDSQRRAVVLRMRDKKDFNEIGKIMGKSSVAVRKLCGRGLKRLGELILEERRCKGE